jgi:hypothetical protein
VDGGAKGSEIAELAGPASFAHSFPPRMPTERRRDCSADRCPTCIYSAASSGQRGAAGRTFPRARMTLGSDFFVEDLWQD